MPQIDPRVDKYIDEKSADFAKPILEHFRNLVHSTLPEVSETIKWGFPHFEQEGIICAMASFKAHCAITFWKASLMEDPNGVFEGVGETAMGQLGKIKSLEDLPADELLTEFMRQGLELNQRGVKVPTKPETKKQELDIPDYFLEELEKHPKAKETFDAFSYSKKKDYVQWVTEAKREATRDQRLATTMEWMSEGKSRNWKYEKC